MGVLAFKMQCMYTLNIANKNYSSWSMRPWVLMKQAGIAFEENKLRFSPDTLNSQFRVRLGEAAPAAKLPTLAVKRAGQADLIVWDSLAIAEYLAEAHPELQLWPRDSTARAQARSMCAEMHSGFSNLRNAWPMNIEARLPHIGAISLRDNAGVRSDVARMLELWQNCLKTSGGALLFGEFTIADAYFAPVVMRFETYQIDLPADVRAYMDRVKALPGVATWIADALAEKDFLPSEEPYRSHA
jgi:glutathione S-transferase